MQGDIDAAVGNACDNNGMTPLLLSAITYVQYNEESQIKERENIIKFMTILLTKCNVDIALSVQKQRQGKKVSFLNFDRRDVDTIPELRLQLHVPI